MAGSSSDQLLDLARENERLKQEIGVLCPQLDHPNREGDGSMGWCYCGRFCYTLTLGPGMLLPIPGRHDTQTP